MSSVIEFQPWTKISRLFRDIVITEKIDGTNAAISIERYPFGWHVGGLDEQGVDHNEPEHTVLAFHPDDQDETGMPDWEYLVWAQSRKRVIDPGMDNHGFAYWVWANAVSLVADLGEGIHFGEWWGKGIQRGYGLSEKRFSLFNVKRWESAEFRTEQLGTVPVLYRGEFSTLAVRGALESLRLGGSVAAPQFMRPEGVVVYHTAGNVLFKATIDNDDMPKGLAA